MSLHSIIFLPWKLSTGVKKIIIVVVVVVVVVSVVAIVVTLRLLRNAVIFSAVCAVMDHCGA